MLFHIPAAGSATDVKQYVAWLIAALAMIVGFRYAKDVGALILEKLYEFFIQHKTFL